VPYDLDIMIDRLAGALMPDELELATAVASVRDELLKAASAAADQDIRFAVGDITMEFSVEMRKDAKAKFGFTAWVVTAGAEGGLGRSDVHKVTVTLRPHMKDGKPVEVSDPSQAGTSKFGRRPGAS
jgi:hypothetical protein